MSTMCRFIVLAWLVLSSAAFADSLLFPFGGSTADATVALSDDDPFTVSLTNPINFFGRSASIDTVYFTDNGILSIVPYEDYIPRGALPADYPAIIAVLHDDFKAYGASAYFRDSTANSDLQLADTYVRELFPSSSFSAASVLVVTWDRFPHFGDSLGLTNTFQAAIATSGTVSYLLYMYEELNTNRVTSTVGATAGDGISFEELPQSRTPDVQRLHLLSQRPGGRLGLFGIGLEKRIPPTPANCVRNTANPQLVDVQFTLFSTEKFLLQALDTDSFANGQRVEAEGAGCKTTVKVASPMISFTVDTLNTTHPGCGVLYVDDSMLNFTIEVFEDVDIYRANDTIVSVHCDVLPARLNLIAEMGEPPFTSEARWNRSLRLDIMYLGRDVVASTAVLGNYLVLRVTYDPGPNSTLADPLRATPLSCTAGDSPTYSSSTAMLSNGCVPQSEKAFKLNGPFVRTSQASDRVWTTQSGWFRASNFLTSKRLYITCNIRFCSGLKTNDCVQSCNTTPTGRKRREDAQKFEYKTIHTSITILDDQSSAERKTGTKSCMDVTIAYTVLGTMSGMVLVGLFTTLAMFYQLKYLQSRQMVGNACHMAGH